MNVGARVLYQAIVPHYARIRDQLAADIACGRFLAGEKLPPERDLAARFGCTRVTLRQALQQLETEGLIYRENRIGWFLCPPRIHYDLLVEFDQEFWRPDAVAVAVAVAVEAQYPS